MNNGNYESKILDAIQIVVDNAISKAQYDRTIQATIVRCEDETIGDYIVQYQDSTFHAYSYNTDVTYIKGSTVYVLVPCGDFSLEKSIVGSVDKIGPDYISIVEGEDAYEVVGVNTIDNKSGFGLCSYTNPDTVILYDRDAAIDLVDLNTFAIEKYIKESNSLICGATILTKLSAEQKYKGNYGLIFSLDFKDNATGEIVTRQYLVDVNKMTGNPYNYTIATRQYSIFDIDGKNFDSVKQISIYSCDFPKTEENKEDDIFISKIELCGATLLDPALTSSSMLSFITPQGIYFDDQDLDSATREIHAQIKIKSKAINNTSQLVKYYWFIENNEVNSQHKKYNRYGGIGWECLNDFSEVEDSTVVWASSDYKFTVKKEDIIAREVIYKCVAVYNNETVLTRTIKIYNYSSPYIIEIKSDSGVDFYYDQGRPNLTCYVNGEEKTSSDFEYVWSSVNQNNDFGILEETTLENETYNAAVSAYNTLIAQIEAEQVLPGAAQNKINEYQKTISIYENKMRVEKNKIHKLQISNITGFSTYQCSVYYKDIFIGSSNIIITNSLTNLNDYSLVITNGNQVFKYNEKGYAPNHPALDTQLEILPLSFILYDDKGRAVENVDKIEWYIPKGTDTLISPSIYQEYKTNDFYYIVNDKEINFNIENTYNFKKINNVIKLIVTYKEKTITAYTNLTFTKEGETGTNGTDYICKIVPYTNDNSVLKDYPMIIHNQATGQSTWNFTPHSTGICFKVQLWKDGEQIFENNVSGQSLENEDVQLEWSMLQNNYGNGNVDMSDFTVDPQTGYIEFTPDTCAIPCNILKCKLTYNNMELFATLPIITAYIANRNYQISLIKDTGFRYAMYTADGKEPQYSNNKPFTLQVLQDINGTFEDVSNRAENYIVNYDWSVLGNVYYTEWHSEQNLIEKTAYNRTGNKNEYHVKPIDSFNGLCVNNAILCSLTQDNNSIGYIHIPVHLYINRYGNSAFNDWDGNSISTGENGDIILSPQVGAGKKNDDNSFTGVFMGSIQESGAAAPEHGLFGYNSGQRTISLNSEDGSARFGVEGRGQIIIDPSTGDAILTSGNYDEEAGTGMEINLSKPSIKFGSGKFGVNAEGQLFADGFATSEYVDSKVEGFEGELENTNQNVDDLMNSVQYFEVFTNTDTVTFPTNADLKVKKAETYIIDLVCTFKGKTVLPTKVELLEPLNGINITTTNTTLEFNITNTDLSFIEELYKTSFKITYKDTKDNQLYTKQKQINIVFVPSGADGHEGQDGKSAYQIWLEAGNTGTEEEYLNSLKGADGESGKGIFSQTQYYLISNKTEKAIQTLHEWDGDATNKPVIENFAGMWEFNFCKVYDEVFSFEELYGQFCEIHAYESEENEKIQILSEKELEENVYLYCGDIDHYNLPFILVIKEPTEGDFENLPVGTYLLYSESAYVSKFSTSNGGISIYTDGWEEEAQVPTAENPYLWYYEKIIYTDDSVHISEPCIIGMYGEQGEDGIGITKITEQYYLSTSETEQVGGQWSETQEAWTKDKFIWTRSKIEWTEGDPTYTDPVLAKAINSANENANAADELAQEAKSGLETLAGTLDEQVKDLQKQIDGAIETWFEDYIPTDLTEPTKTWIDKDLQEEHVGDLFYIISGERSGQCYRYAYADNTYKWLIVEDADLTKAIADAAKAQATADGKATIYTGATTPTNPQGGDLWMKSANDGILTYVNGSWIEYNKYTDDTLATEAKNTADTAKNTADTAKNTADSAKQTADSASQTATNAHNEVQNTVKQVDVEYYVASSETEVPTSSSNWTTIAPQWSAGKFIWSRQKMTFVDASKPAQYSEPARVTGATGKNGEDGLSAYQIAVAGGFKGTEAEWLASLVGKDGVDGKDGTQGIQGPPGSDGKTSYLHIAYANSADGVTDFSTTVSTNKLYIGQYTDFTEADSTTPSKYSWTLIKGADGKDGQDGTNGVGVKSIVNKYALTTDTTAPLKTSTSWKDTPQTITSTNKYLWNYEIITYTNNTTNETTPHIIGAYGDKGTDGGNGTDGKGIVSITEYFKVGTSNTTAPTGTWSTTPETMDSTNKYLWSYEVIKYTIGSDTETKKRVIGTYGEKGANGTSVTISSTEIKYQTSSSGTVVPTDETKWTTTIPSVSAGQYLWTRTIVTYSTNVKTTSYSVSRSGTNGNNGTSISISSKTITYQASNSGTVVPTDETKWTEAIPSVTKGQYLWTRTTVVYSSGDKTTAYSVGYIGTNGEQGYSIVASVSRPSFTEANWNTYGEIGHNENWSATESIRNGCRIGDIFTVVGTATDTKNAHVLYYKSTTASGTLRGECIAHSVAERGAQGSVGPQGPQGNGYVYIEGTQTASTASWTGTTSEISALEAGTQILYKLPYAGKSNVTLNLTLADGSTTGAIACYFVGTTRLGTQYAADATIALMYDGSVWRVVNPYTNSNNYDRILYNANIKATSAVKAGQIIVGTSSGYVPVAAGVSFDLNYPILYAGSAIAANAVNKGTYLAYPAANLTSTLSTASLTINSMVYLVGTLEENVFTIDSQVFAHQGETPTNLYYIPIGIAFSNVGIYFNSSTSICKWGDSGFTDISFANNINGLVSHITVLYAFSNSSADIPEDDQWLEVYDETKRASFTHVWQKIKTTFKDGTTTETAPTCLSGKTIVNTTTEYTYQTFDSLMQIPEGTTPDEKANIFNTNSEKYEWQVQKKSIADIMNLENEAGGIGYYEWLRTHIFWSDGTSTYSTPYCDDTTRTLRTQINDRATQIINSLEGEGCVRIYENQIYVMNKASIEDSTEILCLNNQGIGFAKKEVGEDIDPNSFTSVWHLSGEFDAQKIRVYHLTADDITNGTFRLYDSAGNENDGKILIFEGDPPAEINPNDDHTALISLTLDGLVVKLINGGTFSITRQNGVSVFNSGGEFVYGSSSDGNAFLATKTIIEQQIDFGESLRGIVMEKTLNSKTHKGVGFIRISK